MPTKLIALITSAALAACLCPAAALADGGSADLAAGAAAKPSATSTVWVKRVAGGYTTYKGKRYATTTYNKDGLISKHRYISSFGEAYLHEANYQYNSKGKLTKLTDVNKTSGSKCVSKFTYDKKGQLTKQDIRTTWSATHKARDVLTYKYSSNGRKVTCNGREIGGNFKTRRTIALNKKGYVTSVAEQQHFRRIDDTGPTTKYGKWSASGKAKFAYKYNARGDLVKRKGDFGSLRWSNSGSETYKIRYNDMGDIRLFERTGKKTGYRQSANYVPATVPAKYKDAVEEQQRAIANPSVLAPRFGIDSYLENDAINPTNSGGFAQIL